MDKMQRRALRRMTKRIRNDSVGRAEVGAIEMRRRGVEMEQAAKTVRKARAKAEAVDAMRHRPALALVQ